MGGLCGPDYVGYDPPGGYICSVHGGMHGGDIDERTGARPPLLGTTPNQHASLLLLFLYEPVQKLGLWVPGDAGKWSCPGCTDGYPKAFPSALSLINTSGAKQSTFPNADRWPEDISEAVLETWVNGKRAVINCRSFRGFTAFQCLKRCWLSSPGWFTTFWRLKSWDGDPTSARVVLGTGGFHGGQPHMLDGIQKDGSTGGPDEFLPEANFTNPLDAPSMGGVMIQNLLAELDVEEEWYYNRSSRTLYFFPNRTLANGTAPTPPTVKDSGELAVVRLQNLLRIQGEGAGPTAVPGSDRSWKPARNITVRGVGFRDAGW